MTLHNLIGNNVRARSVMLEHISLYIDIPLLRICWHPGVRLSDAHVVVQLASLCIIRTRGNNKIRMKDTY